MFTKLKQRLQRQFVTPRQISRFRSHRDPVLRAVGVALQAHQSGQLTAAEQQWIDKIERLRVDLCNSKEQLVIPDYGAGSPTSTRSDGVMSNGSVVTEILGEACQNYSKPRVWATLFFQLVRQIRPVNCVELGTCLGISAAYQCAALELNGNGTFTTLEGAPSFASIASRNLHKLGLSHRVSVVVGRFQDTLPDVLSHAKVDYAFVDGHHDERATIRYFEQLLPHLTERSVLVFDDIAWSHGMRRAWNHIKHHPGVDVTLDFSSVGVCLLGVSGREHHNLSIV